MHFVTPTTDCKRNYICFTRILTESKPVFAKNSRIVLEPYIILGNATSKGFKNIMPRSIFVILTFGSQFYLLKKIV